MSRYILLINILSFAVSEICEFYATLFGFKLIADYADHIRVETSDFPYIQLPVLCREQITYLRSQGRGSNHLFQDSWQKMRKRYEDCHKAAIKDYAKGLHLRWADLTTSAHLSQ